MEEKSDKLSKFIDSINIAEDLDKDKLVEIGATVVEGYDYDKESRAEWEQTHEEALNLAKQIADNRTYAGERISDVKYPTIASACIQYAARAYPAIIRGEEVVRYKIIGHDPDGKKAARGKRVAEHMNTQILEQMEGWEAGMDQLLVCQPLLGVYYKKTYYDPIEKINRSELVSPNDLVIYYKEKSVEEAQRKTHVLEYTHNEYLSMVRSDAWRDIDLKKDEEPESKGDPDDTTWTFLEQHCFIDLDGDEYAEPYIVTVHHDTQEVVRIVARYDESSVQRNKKKQVVKIKPIEYFTEFPFMPSFDGGVYRMGFGALLSPLNHAINTLFNQLLDAGKLSNRQGGFIGRNVRLLRGGESGSIQFKAGEWKMVQCTGDDLKKGIFPLPVREPSAVLFQLLGLLLEMSKELSSQSDLLSGQQNQSNVPATSTLALIEQGLKVFSGVYKRTYRALKEEFKKLHRLNAKHLTVMEYANIVDYPDAIGTKDPENDPVPDYLMHDYDMRPVSSTSAITETQKYIKAEAVRSWYGQGGNDEEIRRFWFESLEVPDFEKFVKPPDPGPPPELKLKATELQLKNLALQIKIGELISKDNERREKQYKFRADATKSLAEAEAAEEGPQLQVYQQQLEGIMAHITQMNETAKEVQLARFKEVENAGGQSEPGPSPDSPIPGGMGAAPGVPGGQQIAEPNPTVPGQHNL